MTDFKAIETFMWVVTLGSSPTVAGSTSRSVFDKFVIIDHA